MVVGVFIILLYVRNVLFIVIFEYVGIIIFVG